MAGEGNSSSDNSTGTDNGQSQQGAASTDTGQQGGQQQTGGPSDAELTDLGVSREEYTALGDPGKRALERIRAEARDHKAKIDELSPLAEQWRKAEEAKKPELQRLTDRATTAEQTASQATDELARLRAVTAAGLTGEDAIDIASRLRGNTPEELAADAKALAAKLGAGTQQQTARRTGGPGHNAQGGAGTPSVNEAIRASLGWR